MTTYRAYNTTILDHGFASFHEKIQQKTGTEMLYSNEKQRQGHHSPLAPVIPYKAQRNS